MHSDIDPEAWRIDQLHQQKYGPTPYVKPSFRVDMTQVRKNLAEALSNMNSTQNDHVIDLMNQVTGLQVLGQKSLKLLTRLEQAIKHCNISDFTEVRSEIKAVCNEYHKLLPEPEKQQSEYSEEQQLQAGACPKCGSPLRPFHRILVDPQCSPHNLAANGPCQHAWHEYRMSDPMDSVPAELNPFEVQNPNKLPQDELLPASVDDEKCPACKSRQRTMCCYLGDNYGYCTHNWHGAITNRHSYTGVAPKEVCPGCLAISNLHAPNCSWLESTRSLIGLDTHWLHRMIQNLKEDKVERDVFQHAWDEVKGSLDGVSNRIESFDRKVTEINLSRASTIDLADTNNRLEVLIKKLDTLELTRPTTEQFNAVYERLHALETRVKEDQENSARIEKLTDRLVRLTAATETQFANLHGRIDSSANMAQSTWQEMSTHIEKIKTRARESDTEHATRVKEFEERIAEWEQRKKDIEHYNETVREKNSLSEQRLEVAEANIKNMHGRLGAFDIVIARKEMQVLRDDMKNTQDILKCWRDKPEIDAINERMSLMDERITQQGKDTVALQGSLTFSVNRQNENNVNKSKAIADLADKMTECAAAIAKTDARVTSQAEYQSRQHVRINDCAGALSAQQDRLRYIENTLRNAEAAFNRHGVKSENAECCTEANDNLRRELQNYFTSKFEQLESRLMQASKHQGELRDEWNGFKSRDMMLVNGRISNCESHMRKWQERWDCAVDKNMHNIEMLEPQKKQIEELTENVNGLRCLVSATRLNFGGLNSEIREMLESQRQELEFLLQHSRELPEQLIEALAKIVQSPSHAEIAKDVEKLKKELETLHRAQFDMMMNKKP